MPDLEGMPDKDYNSKLRVKWDLTDEPNEHRATITALLLDNQVRHFQRLAEESRALAGPSWTVDLFDSLKSQLRTHPLPDLCSIQPFTGPTGVVYFFRPRASGMVEATTIDEDGNEKKVQIPEIRLDIAPVTIQAESRMCKAHQRVEGKSLADSTDVLVEALLTEITREVLGTVLNGVTDGATDVVKKDDDLKEQLTRASHNVHRLTQRAPANRIVANHEVLTRLGVDCPDIEEGDEKFRDLGTLDGKWRVFMDPLFPKGKLMAWYQGPSILDTGIIYSPYILYMVTPNFLDPNDMTLRRSVRTRHKITLVRPEFAHVLELD